MTLTARLQSMQKACRDTDAQVWLLAMFGAKGPDPAQKVQLATGPSIDVPRYTESIDAALSLVPSWLSWMVRHSERDDAHHPYYAAYVHSLSGVQYHATSKVNAAIALAHAAILAREDKP